MIVFKPQTRLILVTAFLTGLAIQSFAQNHQIVFTESGGNLTETLDGTSVNGWVRDSGANGEAWIPTITQVLLTNTIPIVWSEPKGESGFNIVQGGNAFTQEVFSDLGLAHDPVDPSHVYQVQINIFDNQGNEISDSVNADVTFIDLGDGTNSIPENQATLPLLGLACLSLLVARHYSKPHPATV